MIVLLELLLSIMLVIAIGLGLYTLYARRKKTFDYSFYKNEWSRILGSLSKGRDSWRLAIIDADSLVDKALRQSRVKGESMGDRLREKQRELTRYNSLWSAHKLRNRLVHEPNVKLTQNITSKALSEFQQALKDLGALT